MRLVIIESPFRSEIPLHAELFKAYVKLCLLDSFARGESPIAFHLLYTQVLDDNDLSQRKLGIDISLEWKKVADTVVYTDFYISSGMQKGIAAAEALNKEVEYRALGHSAIDKMLISLASQPRSA